MSILEKSLKELRLSGLFANPERSVAGSGRQSVGPRRSWN